MTSKQYIDELLKSKGFHISGTPETFCDYITNINIGTPDQLIIINGVRQVIPGKQGEVKLVCRISDAEDLDNNSKLISVHSHAFFKDKDEYVCFGQLHDVIPEGNIDDVKAILTYFLSTFQII